VVGHAFFRKLTKFALRARRDAQPRKTDKRSAFVVVVGKKCEQKSIVSFFLALQAHRYEN
jgi:hypothetical protein